MELWTAEAGGLLTPGDAHPGGGSSSAGSLPVEGLAAALKRSGSAASLADDAPATPASPKRQRGPRAKTYACEECGREFSRPCRLAEHERTHTGERPFACQFPGCDKRYMRASHLDAHACSHTKELATRYPCPVDGCGKGFCTNQRLRRHMVTHTTPRPYACTKPGCTAAFAKRNQLHAHMCTHTGANPHACDHTGCTASFQYPSQLRRHRRTHSEDPRYPCSAPGCTEHFAKWSELQAHRKSHRPTKHTCNICDKKFRIRHELTLHLQRHDPDRPVFACPHEGCTRLYMDERALHAHVKAVHTGSPRYVCPHSACDKTYAYARSLHLHIDKAHRARPPSPPPSTPARRSANAPPAPVTRAPTVLEVATGRAYDDPDVSGRANACDVPGCMFRFKRQAELDVHMVAIHDAGSD